MTAAAHRQDHKIKGAVVEAGTWKLSTDRSTLTITTKGKIEGQGTTATCRCPNATKTDASGATAGPG